MLSRREAILAGGSAVLLAGCGTKPARLLAGAPADVPALGVALELERTLVEMYRAGLPLLTGPEAALARTALAQEQAHAAALAEAIRELGGVPVPARPGSAYRRGFPRSRRAGDWVAFAIAFERKAAAGYAAAIPKLANPRLRSTFGAIMTSEAEHAVALGSGR